MAVYTIHVVGESFDDRQEHIKECRANDPVDLEREPDNKYDENAILVVTEDGKDLGYIGRDKAEWLARVIDEGTKVEAVIYKITGGTTGKPSRGVILRVATAGDDPEVEESETSTSLEDSDIDGVANGCVWFVVIVAVIWLWLII